jgi:hypothetical protein
MFDYQMLWMESQEENCSMDVWMMNEYDGEISIYLYKYKQEIE